MLRQSAIALPRTTCLPVNCKFAVREIGGNHRTVCGKDRVYETSYGRIQYHKPSWIVEKDGRVIQTDGYGNKRYDRRQYKVEGDKVYETDAYGRKQQKFEIKSK
jgi:hypothetical protein